MPRVLAEIENFKNSLKEIEFNDIETIKAKRKGLSQKFKVICLTTLRLYRRCWDCESTKKLLSKKNQ